MPHNVKVHYIVLTWIRSSHVHHESVHILYTTIVGGREMEMEKKRERCVHVCAQQPVTG